MKRIITALLLAALLLGLCACGRGQTRTASDQSAFTWQIQLLGYEVKTALHTDAGVPQYDGAVLDVAVDLRKGSPTYLKHVGVELSAENKRQFFIPRGFAHGFLVLSDEAIFTYKVDNVYAPQHEASIRWNDETLAIDWPINPAEVVTSEKDLHGKTLAEAWVFE